MRIRRTYLEFRHAREISGHSDQGDHTLRFCIAVRFGRCHDRQCIAFDRNFPSVGFSPGHPFDTLALDRKCLLLIVDEYAVLCGNRDAQRTLHGNFDFASVGKRKDRKTGVRGRIHRLEHRIAILAFSLDPHLSPRFTAVDRHFPLLGLGIDAQLRSHGTRPRSAVLTLRLDLFAVDQYEFAAERPVIKSVVIFFHRDSGSVDSVFSVGDRGGFTIGECNRISVIIFDDGGHGYILL